MYGSIARLQLDILDLHLPTSMTPFLYSVLYSTAHSHDMVMNVHLIYIYTRHLKFSLLTLGSCSDRNKLQQNISLYIITFIIEKRRRHRITFVPVCTGVSIYVCVGCFRVCTCHYIIYVYTEYTCMYV